jgi:acetate kinase
MGWIPSYLQGIGERAAAVQGEIVAGLEHLSVTLDEHGSAIHAAVISAYERPCAVRVVEMDEELMIARHTQRLAAPSATEVPG